jgi:hypothetical protein
MDVFEVKKENSMKNVVGLWIDHRKASMVFIKGDTEESVTIDSHVEKHAGRIDGLRSTTPFESQLVHADDSRQKGLTGHLDKYYDQVISSIHAAEAIFIFGPGEAKGELKKRLDKKGLGNIIVKVETIDRMTDRQISAKVREYYKEAPSSN